MNTLILPIKREWFDKIERGEKRIEYRECKPYWRTRIGLGLAGGDRVIFRNGYSGDSPQLVADVVAVCRINGLDTDLKIDADVYAIMFTNVRSVEAKAALEKKGA